MCLIQGRQLTLWVRAVTQRLGKETARAIDSDRSKVALPINHVTYGAGNCGCTLSRSAIPLIVGHEFM